MRCIHIISVIEKERQPIEYYPIIFQDERKTSNQTWEFLQT